MNQMFIYSWMVTGHQRRHEELIKEFQMARMVDEARRQGNSKNQRTSKILTQIGKRLAVIGTTLEERYGDYAESGTKLNQPNKVSECE